MQRKLWFAAKPSLPEMHSMLCTPPQVFRSLGNEATCWSPPSSRLRLQEFALVFIYKMGAARQLYNAFFRRSSTFLVTILVGAVVFERVYDEGMDSLWERMNRGVSGVVQLTGRSPTSLYAIVQFGNVLGRTANVRKSVGQRFEVRWPTSWSRWTLAKWPWRTGRWRNDSLFLYTGYTLVERGISPVSQGSTLS